MTEPGRTIIACGCVLGRERCIDCRPGIHPDQLTALTITLKRAVERLASGEEASKTEAGDG